MFEFIRVYIETEINRMQQEYHKTLEYKLLVLKLQAKQNLEK